MLRRHLLSLLFLLLPAIVVAEQTAKPFIELPATPELLAEVRQGGFVLYMRHGATDSAQPDQVPIVLNDCRTQRPLTEQGREEIRLVGQAVRQWGLPVDKVYASPLCRAKESAQLAFGNEIEVVNELMYTAHLTSEEKRPIIAMTRQLLSQPVSPGSNRVLVAHAPNLADLMGYFPQVEGTLVIFRPTETGFEYLASIYPQQWADLIAPRKGEPNE